MANLEKWINETPVIHDIVDLRPTVWVNENKKADQDSWEEIYLNESDINEADERLRRFAPLLMKYFEDTRETKGIIESPLKKIKSMEKSIKVSSNFRGDLFLKMDSHLAIAGSIKARGGIYEVLCYAEQLALQNELITLEDDYSELSNNNNREFFSQYTIQVGSTGNLGLSIGITSAALGFKVIVHMSSDAKQWKKDLLREKGAVVIEYEGDFTSAVEQGRIKSDLDPNSYFIDDENSNTLFIGYAVAALRIKDQMKDLNIKVDANNPVFFYIPCGVGGSPGGVTFGLKKIFGDNVHVFFIEPTHAPSMLIGMSTKLHDKVSVQDFGIDGVTEADGLAVGTASAFVGKVMETLLSGIFTIEDKELFNYMRQLEKTENIRIEPSACASFEGVIKLFEYDSTKEYLEKNNLLDKLDNITHIAWATGGNLVPNGVMEEYLKIYL